jgi:hypothetical protein
VPDTQDNKLIHGLEHHVLLSVLQQFAEKGHQMSVKRMVRKMIVLAALLSIAGCGHVQTMSMPNPVTVQDFGCHGDKTCPYAPYCHPSVSENCFIGGAFCGNRQSGVSPAAQCGMFGCPGCEDVCPKRIPLQDQLGMLRRKMGFSQVKLI